MHPKLQAFNNEIIIPHKSGPCVGGYWVFFDGYIGAQDNFNLIGSVRAYPTQENQKAWEDHIYFVGVIRGRGWGTYTSGDYFDLRPEVGRTHFTMADLETESGRTAMRDAVEEAVARMIVMLQDHAAGMPVPKNANVFTRAFDAETGELIDPSPHHQDVVDVMVAFQRHKYADQLAYERSQREIERGRKWLEEHPEVINDLKARRAAV